MHARRCLIRRPSPTAAPLRVVHDALPRPLPRRTRPLPSARRSDVGTVERFGGGCRTAGDELGRSREVAVPEVRRAWQHDVVNRDTRRQARELRLGSGRALDGHRPARHADGGARSVALGAALAGVECPHLVGSSRDGCRQGDVGDHTTVDEQVAAPGHRRKDPRYGGAGQDGWHHRAVAKAALRSRREVRGDHDERHGGVLDLPITEVSFEQGAQPVRRTHVIRAQSEADQLDSSRGRKDVPTAKPLPDLDEAPCSVRAWVGSQERSVDRADRGADEQVGHDSRTEENLERARLGSTAVPSPRADDGAHRLTTGSGDIGGLRGGEAPIALRGRSTPCARAARRPQPRPPPWPRCRHRGARHRRSSGRSRRRAGRRAPRWRTPASTTNATIGEGTRRASLARWRPRT